MARSTAAARDERDRARARATGRRRSRTRRSSCGCSSQVFDDGIAYNAPGAFQLEGPLDLDVLARAFEALTERHEILRTTYAVIDGKPMQIVGPVVPVELNVVDLRARSADERDAEAQRILKEESRFRFDLVNGPVMRPTVIRLDRRRAHPDARTCTTSPPTATRARAIYHDLTVLYEAFADGPPRAARSASDPVRRLRRLAARWLDGGVADSQLEYWKQQAARARPRAWTSRPTFPRPPVRSYVGDNMSSMIDIATREGLRATARRNDATLFVALLAVFATLLGRYSGPGRRRHRHAVRGAQPHRARIDGRLLHQPAGAADRPLGRPDVRRADRARPRAPRSRRSRTPTCRTRRSCARPTRSATSARRRCSRR